MLILVDSRLTRLEKTRLNTVENTIIKTSTQSILSFLPTIISIRYLLITEEPRLRVELKMPRIR